MLLVLAGGEGDRELAAWGLALMLAVLALSRGAASGGTPLLCDGNS